MQYYVIYCPEMAKKFRNPIITLNLLPVDKYEEWLKRPEVHSYIPRNVTPSYIAIWKCDSKQDAEQWRKQLAEVVRNGREGLIDA